MFFALDIVFFCAFCMWLKELFADWLAKGKEKSRVVPPARKPRQPFRFVTPLGDSLKKGGKQKVGKICSRTKRTIIAGD